MVAESCLSLWQSFSGDLTFLVTPLNMSISMSTAVYVFLLIGTKLILNAEQSSLDKGRLVL